MREALKNARRAVELLSRGEPDGKPVGALQDFARIALQADQPAEAFEAHLRREALLSPFEFGPGLNYVEHAPGALASSYHAYLEAVEAAERTGHPRDAIRFLFKALGAQLAFAHDFSDFEFAQVPLQLRRLHGLASGLGLSVCSCRAFLKAVMPSFPERGRLFGALGQVALGWGMAAEAFFLAWAGLVSGAAEKLAKDGPLSLLACHEAGYGAAALANRRDRALGMAQAAVSGLQNLRRYAFENWAPDRHALLLAQERLWVSRSLALQVEPSQGAYLDWAWVNGSNDALRRRVWTHVRNEGTPAQGERMQDYLEANRQVRELQGAGRGEDEALQDLRLRRETCWRAVLASLAGTVNARILSESDPPLLPILPFGSVLIDFARVEAEPFLHACTGLPKGPHWFAFVLKPGATKWIHLGPAGPIEAAVETLGRGMAKLDDFDPEVFALLWDLLFGPLQAHLRGRNKVWLIPHGLLQQVPWDALEPPARLGARRKPWVLEPVELRVLGSVRDFAAPGSVVGRTRDRIAYVFGDPSFDALPRQGPLSSRRGHTARCLRDLKRFAPLEHTRSEALGIREALGGHGVELRLGDAASEAELLGVKHPSLLHFATHGFWMPMPGGGALPEDLDAMSRTGLALAGANAALEKGSGEGLFTADKALSLELDGTFVVLSACSTALGHLVDFEESAGLRTAFRLAGAGAVAANLWPVSDEWSERLVTEMFRNLARGLSPHQALRKAKGSCWSDLRREYRLCHQYFWAPLQLWGLGGFQAAEYEAGPQGSSAW